MFLMLYHILTICSLSVSIGTDYMNIVLLFKTESICFYMLVEKFVVLNKLGKEMLVIYVALA